MSKLMELEYIDMIIQKYEQFFDKILKYKI